MMSQPKGWFDCGYSVLKNFISLPFGIDLWLLPDF
jgi:hypothetical protein